jgi:division protein CdvB (Snf7/Vps24/ESCRT-III family)
MPNVERGSCRFNLRKTSEGRPMIEMEMFHNTVPHLAAVMLSFEVLSRITIEQTRNLIEKMNDHIVGLVVTPK